jgi:hypothetical protein
MKQNEVHADIIEWALGLHDVISDEAAYAIVGEFKIDGTVADGDGLRDEILRKGMKLSHPPELAALLGWVYFHHYAEPVIT